MPLLCHSIRWVHWTHSLCNPNHPLVDNTTKIYNSLSHNIIIPTPARQYILSSVKGTDKQIKQGGKDCSEILLLGNKEEY